MRSFLTALQFLTVIPLKRRAPLKEDLAKSMAFFPLVGMIIGAFLTLINLVIFPLFPPFMTNALIIIVWIWITGAFHLDGFADTIDGFSGGRDKEEILKIMKDSSIGAKGAIGLACLLGLKFSFLLGMSSYRNYALLFAPLAGRWSMVMGATLAPYAREEQGLGKAFINHKGRENLWASLTMLILGLVLFQWIFFYLLGLTLGITLLSTAYFKRKIGGVTGDTLGSLNEIMEVAVLFFIFCFSLSLQR